MKKLYANIFKLFLWLSVFLIKVEGYAQIYDIGAPAMSTLRWKEVNAWDFAGHGIGLTTDKKVYVWGNNMYYTIHTNKDRNNQAKLQVAPYYRPLPNGDLGKKVRVRGINKGVYTCMFYALAESGKLYAWGYNDGMAENAWPKQTTLPVLTDTSYTVRVPVALTIAGETSFVDFDAPRDDPWWVVIGASGNAYHIGTLYTGIKNTTFTAIQKPDGVDASFKYVKVWISSWDNYPSMYLKGNNGKIYFLSSFLTSTYVSGVPDIYPRNTTAPTLSTAERSGNIMNFPPREVPFPAGEDIVSISVTHLQSSNQYTNFAISASGKAYAAGLWRMQSSPTPYINNYATYVSAPLKSVPAPADLDSWYVGSGVIDTLYLLKRYTEVALPPGATKILDIEAANYRSLHPSLVVGDNYKVYWSGAVMNVGRNHVGLGNYLSTTSSDEYQPDNCGEVQNAHAFSKYSWVSEAITFEGTADIERTSANDQLILISKNGVGYLQGKVAVNMPVGKFFNGGDWGITYFPVPFANELLLDCNTSPGTGGSGSGPTASAAGTIDCSKTQIVSAPIAGSASQHALVVTIAVSATGVFSPVTVSGSGMSLANGITAITATKAGTQQFHIPLNYDGTALTNNFQFTIGTAGSCSADLTLQSKPTLRNVFTLQNCTAITPGTLSK